MQEEAVRGLRRLLEAKMEIRGAVASSGHAMAAAEQFETAQGNVMIMS